MNINIADVNPGDELTVRVGLPSNPEYWVTLSGKVRLNHMGRLLLGDQIVRRSDGDLGGYICEIVSHTPAKPTEPEHIDIADVNPGDELTVKIGPTAYPESWATLSGKVYIDSLGCLELGTVSIRHPDGFAEWWVREIVSHTPGSTT